MNEKIQAILLKIIIEIKSKGWIPSKDWEITLKSEGHVPLTKSIKVEGFMDDEQWEDNIETFVDFKLETRDDITYFPKCFVHTSISIANLNIKDIDNEFGIDVAFTVDDVRNDRSIKNAANRTNNLIEEYVRHEYNNYVSENSQRIKLHNLGAIDDDDDDA